MICCGRWKERTYLFAVTLLVSFASNAEAQTSTVLLQIRSSRDSAIVDGAAGSLIPISAAGGVVASRTAIASVAAQGLLRFDGVSAGPYRIQVRRLGYAEHFIDVTIRGANDTLKTVAYLTEKKMDLQAVSVVTNPRSPWLGARVALPLSGDATVDDFQAYATTKLEALGSQSHRFGVHVLGNLSRLNANPSANNDLKKDSLKLMEIQRSTQGITVAVAPHVFFGEAVEKSATFFVAAGYKVNALKDTLQETKYLNQFRFGGGIGVTFWKGVASKLPVDLTVGTSWSAFSKSIYHSVFREARSYVGTADASLIVPVGAGLGLLLEGSSPISGGGKTMFRAGLTLAPTP